MLQKSTLDVVAAWTCFHDRMSILKVRREKSEEHFKKIYEDAKLIMKSLDVIESTPRLSNKQINGPNPPSTNPEDYYRIALYNPLLDSILLDCQDRFKPDVKMHCLYII